MARAGAPGRQRRLALTLVLAAALVVIWPATPGLAAQSAAPAYAIKANYLVRFAAFVQWPPEAFSSRASPISVCVLGHDPFGASLDRAAAAQSVDGRTVVVRRLSHVDSGSECQVLYLGRSSRQSVADALRALADAPVLVVTDSALGRTRGVIHFAIAGNRVRFHVDDAAAARRGLSVSSRLLSLALSVERRS